MVYTSNKSVPEMAIDPCNDVDVLPLRCTKHEKAFYIRRPKDTYKVVPP